MSLLYQIKIMKYHVTKKENEKSIFKLTTFPSYLLFLVECILLDLFFVESE